MNWLEVSLTLDGEMAEAVAEVLARFTPNGVVIESTAIESTPEDEGVQIGPLRACAYLPMDEKIEETRQHIEESLWYLGRIRHLPPPEFKLIEERNWAETWKTHYKPIPIGERLIILPAWIDSPDDSRIPIRIDPGMAFGTGTHPTTQLVLEMLEDYTPDEGNVIDIGCGSGILSIVALKLGARLAVGVDIDPEAIPNARKNAKMNGVEYQTQFSVGSIDEVKSGVFEVDHAHLVVANILAPILIRLLKAGLGDLIAPGGVLILSGIFDDQIDPMLEKITEYGLRVVDKRVIDDWVALAVKL